MKKTVLLFWAAFLCLASASAQSPCGVVITGDFDSECLYDFKAEYIDEYPDLMIACKHSTVNYAAYAYTGTATVTEYIWEVFGDVSHSTSTSHCTVHWSDGEWGMVVVSIVTSDGDTCTESRHVKLIDNPTVGTVTIPAYTVQPDGSKVVYVCRGMSVTFIDQSDPGNSDIAGIHWGCSNALAQPSSTPTYTIENVFMSSEVTHRVYNNCGCYDEEKITIEMLYGEILELDCYGTVCEGDVVEYRATSPICQDYQWYVEGGTLIAGQGTDNPVVQWDHPVDGYGVIGLDGHLCDNLACPALMRKMVHVIQDNLAIDGQTNVCVGEAVLFSLPLFGSTEYTWSIAPTTGISSYTATNANEVRIVFNQAGTYTLSCTYRCDFLECGPYNAEDLTIIVNPKFSITGNNRICLANACDLQTSPSVSATWTVYDLGNSNTPVGTPATGTAFSRTFSHAGRYLVTAESSGWCGPATFVLEVKDVPPAPTAADLNPTNRHTACPFLGIALNGTPSDPNYNLVWEPTSVTASPQLFTGDSVTVSYQADVCGIRVYNYDVVMQCQSTDFYLHQVTELAVEPLNLPPTITACPGSIIDWTSGKVPDQRSESMLYEWSIEPNKQYCASVQGSHFNPGISLMVNEISPTSFYVELKRRYCGGVADTMIYINVLTDIPESLTIAGPDQVCVGSSATYTGSGGTPATYQWETAGTHRTGNPVSQIFPSEGYSAVTLCSTPFTYCTNASYYNCTTKTVLVNPLPTVYDIVKNGTTLSLLPAGMASPGYSFWWTYRATEQSMEMPLGFNATATYSSPGTYSCTVTDNSTGCSRTINKILPEESCDSMTLAASYNACTRTLTLVSPQYSSTVYWQVTGGNHSIVLSGTNNRQADITFEDIGTYSVSAHLGMMHCYKGTYIKTVDFIPDFEFQQACGSINIVNHSRYLAPGSTVYMTVTNTNNSSVDVVSVPVSQEEYTYTPSVAIPNGTGTYTCHFELTGYGSNTISPSCNLGGLTVSMLPTPSGNPVTITSSNTSLPNNTCDNTPMELTATLNVPGVSFASATWNFGDGSGYNTTDNTLFHTYSEPGSYFLTVSVTDNLGCPWSSSAPFVISSHTNSLYGGLIHTNDPVTCPFFNARDLEFTGHSSTNSYKWWRHKAPTPLTPGYPYPAYQSDDYFTYVINNNYCQAEATKFIKFKNAPTARIHTESLNCCVYDRVMLYGEAGPGNSNVTYAWSVTGPSPTSSTDPTVDNFSFIPSAAGTYTVTLTVTNDQGCSSTTTETITAHAQPAAPTIAFAGNPCISDAPVEIVAAGCSGELHWNNGATGSTAYYFTPGMVTVYCFDPAIGCNSDTASLTIIRQPDFDALLTGCYKKCKEQSTGYLPAYGLSAFMQEIYYSWSYPGGILSGYYTYTNSPLLLPYTFGSHYMTASASITACPRTSQTLLITQKDTCDCDSVDVSYVITPTLDDCKLNYEIKVTVCNRSKTKAFCIDEFEVLYPQGNVSILSENLTGNTVSANDCDDFTIILKVNLFIPSELLIRLTDAECSECTKDFVIDLKPIITCTEKMEEVVIEDINASLSSDVAAYFDFNARFISGQNLLAFWSEPPMVVNYNYDIITGLLQGLGMIDMATLSRLLAENTTICFYAIVCKNNKLCKQEYCFKASELYDMVIDADILSEKSKSTNSPDADGPQLKPNPTTGDVKVVGTTDEVREVLVMDMHGRKIATFNRTTTFSVENLSSGMYIVRVKTKHDKDSAEKVTYLKLVKK